MNRPFSIVTFLTLLIVVSHGFAQGQTAPSRHAEFVRVHRDVAKSIRMDQGMPSISRVYENDDCKFIYPGRESEPTVEEWYLWVRKILSQHRVMNEPLLRSGSSILEDSPGFSLYRFEYHDQAERRRIDGERFFQVDVMFGVATTEKLSDVDLAYHYVKRGLIRPMALPWLLGPSQRISGSLLGRWATVHMPNDPHKRRSRPKNRGSAIRVGSHLLAFGRVPHLL